VLDKVRGYEIMGLRNASFIALMVNVEEVGEERKY
jgi:hypothetical protein